ncbi:MAG: lectin-like protein, partial [Planctomycetota bacterium]|nr:lectin-like protein [Planctomycetota bacterium]
MPRRATLASLLLLATASQAAPIQWTSASGGNDHFYELVFPTAPVSWTDARNAAASSSHLGLAGHLATISSLGESEFLRTNYESLLTVQKFATGDDQDGDFVWIGMNDAAVEGVYVWITGEPVTFTDWGPFEPNNLGNQDYALIRVLEDGRVGGGPTWQWDDNFLLPMSGVDRLGYIVEFEPMPEP